MSFKQILEIDRERVRREKVVLHTIYDRVKNRINIVAKNRNQACVYEIPIFIPGYPLTNVDKTMKYLLKKLIKEGFYAIQIDSVNIYIAWDPLSIRELDRREKRKLKNKNNNDYVEDTEEKRKDDYFDFLIKEKVNNIYKN